MFIFFAIKFEQVMVNETKNILEFFLQFFLFSEDLR
jgi:hypothetical protein